MSIAITDLATATADYLHQQVETRIARVTGNLSPGQSGTFTVRITNSAAPTGVRLTGVFLHLFAEPGSVALLEPPGSPLFEPRATADINAPRLHTNELVDELFLFFNAQSGPVEPNATLDVGEVLELTIGYRAQASGTGEFTVHVHGKFDVDDLFGLDRGGNASKDVRVRS